MVNSLVWTPEEAKYLKAIFRWQESTTAVDDEKRRRQAEEAARRREQEQKPAGEFRVLVIGGRGTGKTAILTRVRQPQTLVHPHQPSVTNIPSPQFGQGTFHGESQPPDPFYERGCRHPITLSVIPPIPKFPTTPTSPQKTTATTTTTTTTADRTQQRPQQPAQPFPIKQTYMIDALEMPSKHLLSNPMLAQALSITEAAVLVYSVRDEASFRLAQGLAEFMREYFSCAAPSQAAPSPPSSASSSSGTAVAAGMKGARSRIGNANADKGRPYPIILVGNKADPAADDDPVAILQEERAVSYTEACKAAAAGGMRIPGLLGDGDGDGATGVPFLEVSAKTGEGVDQIFQVLGREVLRVRRLVRERRELAERERLMSEVGSVTTAGGDGGRKRFGLWRGFFGRRRAVG